MTKTKPRITIHFLKLMYLLGRKPIHIKNKVHCAYGGKMKDEDFNYYTSLVNELKNGK